jgi:hypothetical protein
MHSISIVLYVLKPIDTIAMAKPIQPTPTLEGKDAENFYKELERVKTKEEIARLRHNFKDADKTFKLLGRHLIEKMLD